jgi:hypothetical protein
MPRYKSHAEMRTLLLDQAITNIRLDIYNFQTQCPVNVRNNLVLNVRIWGTEYMYESHTTIKINNYYFL